MGEQRVFLENGVELPAVGRQMGDILAVEDDLALIRFSNPPRIRRVVVLPQPLGPSSVRNSFHGYINSGHPVPYRRRRIWKYVQDRSVCCSWHCSPPLKGLETRRGADPDQGSAGFLTGSNIMILIGGDVKGFPLFGFERPVAQMNDDASGQNITEFFSFMGKIRYVEPPGASVRRIGSMLFFWALGMIHSILFFNSASTFSK